MSEHVDVSNIKDPSIAAARKEVEFQRAMNPCPIDFSEFQSSNPRSQGEQKVYGLSIVLGLTALLSPSICLA